MVKIKRSFPAPKSLEEEAGKLNGRYDKRDVIDRLKKDFHNKFEYYPQSVKAGVGICGI